jgi:hypothetical protein
MSSFLTPIGKKKKKLKTISTWQRIDKKEQREQRLIDPLEQYQEDLEA